MEERQESQEPQEFGREAYVREMFDNMLNTITHLLQPVPTVCLVRELEKREGVQPIQVNPYEPFKITGKDFVIPDTGPATILIITD